MTEAEFNCCEDPQSMLLFLRQAAQGAARPFRLFVLAVYQMFPERLPSAEERRVVAAYERYAAGRATEQDLRAAAQVLSEALPPLDEEQQPPLEYVLAGDAADPWEQALALTFFPPFQRRATVLQRMSALLRDLFGPLPFRAVPLDRSLLAWHDGVIPHFAQEIAEKCAWDRLPVLADMLEAAGLTDPDILAHCRQREGHTRGCWCLDLLSHRRA